MIGVGILILLVIVAIALAKKKPPIPECTEGATACIGTDLYTCVSGKWTLTEEDSLTCDFLPPPPLPPLSVIISGTVTDINTGVPIHNATVRIYGRPNKPGAIVYTDTEGHYAAELPPAEYCFCINAPDYQFLWYPGHESYTEILSDTVTDFGLESSA